MALREWLALGALVLGLEGAAGQTITGSQLSDWAAGEQMAKCSAFFVLAAEIGTKAGRPAAAEHLENVARGWRLAAMMLLASGADRQGFDADGTSQGIADGRLSALRASAEAGGAAAFATIQAEQRRLCDPLQQTQEAIIRALRKSSGG